MNKKLPRRAQILAYLQECYQLKHPEASLPTQVSPMRASEIELDVQYIDKNEFKGRLHKQVCKPDCHSNVVDYPYHGYTS